jgi:hypothetical protein
MMRQLLQGHEIGVQPCVTDMGGVEGTLREVSVDRNTATDTQTLNRAKGVGKPAGNQRKTINNHENQQTSWTLPRLKLSGSLEGVMSEF